MALIQALRDWLAGRESFHLVLCACGCGRTMRSDAGWDGYHGPGTEPAP